MSPPKEEWEIIVEKIRQQAADEHKNKYAARDAAIAALRQAFECSEYTRSEQVYAAAWRLLKVLDRG